jgi:hypothetical protein
MDKQLMDVVLPRLARPLYRQLERYQTGKMDDDTFTERFESLLRRQHAWLEKRGISGRRAAIAIHAAVLVLSLPGLRAEAAEDNLPLEVVEHRAVREAAADVAANYGIPEPRAAQAIASLVAQYGD